MSSSNVDRIKERLGIVDVLSNYIKLEKSGGNYKAKCPFHNEKTPSFFVSPTRNSFYCFGCFPPGQLIKTPIGYHSIETLDKNHYVYSGKGNIRKVLATQHRQYSGELIDVTVQKMGGIVSLTSDHNLPVIRPNTKYYKIAKQFYRQLRGYESVDPTKNNSLNNDQISQYASILNISAGELKKSDFVLYPINTSITDIKKIDLTDYLTKSYTKGPRPKSIPYKVSIDDDFLKLIGYYIAEGSNHRAYIRFSLGNHEEDFAEEIVYLIKKIFGLKASIHRRPGPKTGLEITACHAYLASIFENLCGLGSENKHIPFIFQELPSPKALVLVNAINRGDGHVFIPKLTTHTFNVIKVVSRVLIEQITDILLRANVFPSVSTSKKRIDSKGVHHKESYNIKWSYTARVRHCLIYNDGNSVNWLLPVKKILRRKYEGPVYNLTVDEDHSYVATNFSVNNCGQKGDIFTFVEQFEGLDFKGALKVLAQNAGIPLEFETSESKNEKDRLFRLLEIATEFFEGNLKGNKITENYLKQRGLKSEMVKDWRLGFALATWQSLIEFCRKKGFKDSELIKAGLAKQTENKKFYDVFRGRVMFPIFDTAGRPIAFSGRVLEETENTPKYLNSPETELFNKSDVLYGFDKAKLSIKKKNYSVLVEGQMDLLLSHQAGFDNTVATSGTALTTLQLTRLNHLSSRIILAYDGDKAGFKAIERSAKLALSLGMNVRIALLPQDEDPASVIVKDPQIWSDILKNSTHIIDFYLERISASHIAGRLIDQEIKKRVLPFVKLLPSNIDQSRFLLEIADKTGINESALREDLKKVVVDESHELVKDVDSSKIIKSRQLNIAGRIAGIIFWQAGLNKNQPENGVAMERLKSTLKDKQQFIELEKRRSELIFEAETYFEGREDIAVIMEDLFFNLDEEILKNEFQEAMKELMNAEKSGDKEKVSQILEKCKEVSKKINAMNEKKVIKL